MTDMFTTGNLGLTHTLLALLAMLCGWRVLVKPKGNRLHKITGHIYVTAMVAMNGTGLFIQSLFQLGIRYPNASKMAKIGVASRLYRFSAFPPIAVLAAIIVRVAGESSFLSRESFSEGTNST